MYFAWHIAIFRSYTHPRASRCSAAETLSFIFWMKNKLPQAFRDMLWFECSILLQSAAFHFARFVFFFAPRNDPSVQRSRTVEQTSASFGNHDLVDDLCVLSVLFEVYLMLFIRLPSLIDVDVYGKVPQMSFELTRSLRATERSILLSQ